MTTEKILTRDFVLSFFAQFTFASVFCTLIPTIPVYLSRLGAKEAEIGFLIGISSVFSLVLRPLIGRALLRIPERSFMLAGALLLTISSIAYLWAPPFWPFLIVRVVQGISIAFFFTASFTLVGNISPESRRGQSLSLFYLSMNIALALAPSFGMWLINLFSFTVLFLVCTGFSLGSLFITSKLRKMQGVPSEGPPGGQPFLSREALRPAIMGFFTNIIWGSLSAFFPLYALSQGMTNPGLFFGAFAIMLILGRGFGGKILDTYSREQVILPCLTTYVISMAILAFSKTLPMFLLVAVIWGIGNAFLFPTLVAFALDRAGSSRGPAMGTFTAVTDLGVGIGAAMMGLILNWTSYPTMFLCLAVISVINLLYFHFFIRKKGGNGYANL